VMKTFLTGRSNTKFRALLESLVFQNQGTNFGM
jgi:hypothetical protein